MPATAPLLQLDRVSRRLGGREVLHEISFSLQRGEVLGLLGINGAGKSTTLAVIAGVLAPAAGHILLDGRDVTGDRKATARRIGWVAESVPLWDELTVDEALDAAGRLHGLSREARRAAARRELERFELGAVARRLCGQLSLGQRRRMGLAQALVHEPDLLVLDEPGNGLDPVQAAQLRELLGRLAPERGIVLSSHALAEVEALCSRVVILHAGAVRHDARLDGRPGALEERFHAIARSPVANAA